MSRVVSFYRGEVADPSGRTIDELWALDHDQLEELHDFIQQLFPLWTGGVAPGPLLDDATCAAFRADAELRRRLLRSLDVMLDFYGLQRAGNEVTRAANFAARAANWLTPGNHNFLRLTRILTCLRELGLGEWSRALLVCQEGVAAERPGVVGDSLRFWRAAV